MSDLATLGQLASKLKVPKNWLKEEAKAGRLPCLRAGRRLFFSFAAVENALASRAAEMSQKSEGVTCGR